MLRVLPVKANLFCSECPMSCVWPNSRVILSNQSSVFTQLATAWFVARQVWTWVIKRATSSSTTSVVMFYNKFRVLVAPFTPLYLPWQLICFLRCELRIIAEWTWKNLTLSGIFFWLKFCVNSCLLAVSLLCMKVYSVYLFALGGLVIIWAKSF